MQPADLFTRFTMLFNNIDETQLTHLSPQWAPPRHSRDVTVYINSKSGYRKITAHYDFNRGCFAKTNGVALYAILGWIE